MWSEEFDNLLHKSVGPVAVHRFVPEILTVKITTVFLLMSVLRCRQAGHWDIATAIIYDDKP